MISIDQVRKELLRDVINDFVETAESQRNGVALSDIEMENISTLALIVSECFSPIMYKLKKIQLTKPGFAAKRVDLSPLAYERFQLLLKKKLVNNNGLCLGMRYTRSTRVSNEIYCRIVGDVVEH